MNNRIYLSPPHLSEESSLRLNDAVASNWIAPRGPMLEEWEASIQRDTGRFPVLTTSGEAALILALRVLDVKKGQRVLTASHTCNASVNAILHIGAIPVFVDSDEVTWNMSQVYLTKAIRSLREEGLVIGAIMFVSIYGSSNGFQEVQYIANEFEIPLLEDAAESVGSKLGNEYVGCLGDAGVWSFNGNKIITTSGGGAALFKTKDEQQLALKWATQSKEDAPWYEHKEIGYSFRMSNLLAAIGIGQWNVLEDRVRQRVSNFNRYEALLESLGMAEKVHTYDAGHFSSNCWLSAFIFDRSLEVEPQDIIEYLESKNIEARYLWKPMELHQAYKGYRYFGPTPGIAQGLFERGVCFPSGSSLSEDDWSRIEKALNELFSK